LWRWPFGRWEEGAPAAGPPPGQRPRAATHRSAGPARAFQPGTAAPGEHPAQPWNAGRQAC